MREDLMGRADIKRLVVNFYSKIRKDKETGYFFNNFIQNWEEHFEKLTDFWESNLFFSGTFRGNPALAHVKVDMQLENSITPYHFGIWLNYWFQTIDELFQGERTQRLKTNARKMSTHLFLKIYQVRQLGKS